MGIRAPQYGHNSGKHRGLNPFSRPLARFVTVARGRGRMVRKMRPVTLPRPMVPGSVTVQAPNIRVRLLLWHKNVAVLGRRGKKGSLPNPVVSKDVHVIEPPRKLCAIPPRERPKSRNDVTRYWLAIPGKPGKSPRTGIFTLRAPQ